MQKKESAPAESPADETPAPAPRRFRLELDHDGIYFGAQELAGEQQALGADDVILDHMPDNAPGMYRWSREHRRLEPLPKAQQKKEPGAPTLEQAFYGFLANGPEDPRTRAWRDWFEKTLDAKGMTKP